VTVLVTGATGLLGSHVVDRLLERGERPRVLVRPGESLGALPERAIDVCRGDLADRAALQGALEGADCVFHCAARTGPWGPAADYERANVRGLATLLELSHAAGVRRVVHVSSVTVHGNDVGGAADETAPLRIEPNPYSRSKVAGERLVEQFVREQGAPVVVVRPGWIYGPRDRASFARFAAMIEQGRMIVIGSGRNCLPLIHVRDAAQGLLLAGEAPNAAGEAYLLVNDERVSQLDYLGAIATELGVATPTRRIPYRLALLMGAAAETAGRLLRSTRPPPLTRYGLQLLGGENRFSIEKARRELDFAPEVNLASGVRETAAWYRSSSPETARPGIPAPAAR
jgi:nucleoside-diphosphate-sugar epimerase